jgi:hypothetical protein
MNKFIWTFVFTTIALAIILVFVSIFAPLPQPILTDLLDEDSEASSENQNFFADPDQSFFVNPVDTWQELPESTTPETIEVVAGAFVGEGCQVTGCSSNICANAGEDINSTCEWLEEYACYQEPGTQCVQDPQGQCGWVMSEELQVCLDTKSMDNEVI